MHFVGLYTYCRMMHGAYNVKYTVEQLRSVPLVYIRTRSKKAAKTLLLTNLDKNKKNWRVSTHLWRRIAALLKESVKGSTLLAC